MSIRVMSEVWDESPSEKGSLLVLLALADHANEDGVAWPKIATIAHKARLTERGVQKIINALVETGELRVYRGGFLDGQNQSSTYHILTGRTKFAPTEREGRVLHPGGEPGDTTGVNPGSPLVEPSVEPSEETSGADQAALFDAGTSEPSPSKPAVDPDDAKLEEVWANHVRLFGDRMRVKELTPPRRRTLLKALRAVGGDHTVLMRASEGLKFYRDGHPDGSSNVGIDVIFETGPHSTRNLTETIEWWASQSPGSSSERHDIPSVLRDRVRRRRVQIVEALRSPELSGAQERAEEAKRWLREHAHEEPVIEGTRVVEWRRV